MNWLAQNWLWILLAVGVLFVLGRSGHHGRRGYGYHGGHGGSLGSGGFGHAGHSAGDGSGDRSTHSTDPKIAIDPVTRHDVATDHAATSVYQGRIYYFETAESRQRFEASPEQYAREGLGRPLSPTQGASEPGRRRRGGC